jgi:PAS domain-containing protein
VPGVLVWQRRSAPCATYLALLQLAVSEWTLCGAFEAAAPTIPAVRLWGQLGYVGTAFSPVFFFLFAFHYVNAERPNRVRLLLLLSLLPALTILAAATSNWHQLLWTAIQRSPATGIVQYGHGPFFWVFVAYSWLLVMLGTVSLWQAMLRFAPYYRSQTILLLIASVLPSVGNILYVSNWNPYPGLDWTPVALALTSLLLGWALYRLRMLNIVPIARNLLIEDMPDAVLVLDLQHRVVDINPAARELLIGRPLRPIGMPLGTVLPAASPLVEALADGRTSPPLLVSQEDQVRVFGAQLSVLRAHRGEPLGHLLVFRDITGRRRLATERERLITELQTALADVRTLSGLLPICAACKRIRDDQGYWHGVEAFVRAHSYVEFTHGLCPQCARELDGPLASEPLAASPEPARTPPTSTSS